MRGRKKTMNAKTQVIRITLQTRMDLWEIRREYKMPTRYNEGDVIEQIITQLKKDHVGQCMM